MFFAEIPGWEQLIQGIAYVIKYLYQLTGNFGFAIIILTVGMRVLLFPLTYKQTKSMIAMQRLMPQMKEIQKKYKDDREKQGQEMMALYKEHKVSPFSSCLPMLLQLPIMFAVFEVLRGLTFTITKTTLASKIPQVIRIIAGDGFTITKTTLAKDIPQIAKVIAPGSQTFMFLGMDLRHAGSALWQHGDYVQIIVMMILTLLTGFLSSSMMATEDKQSKMMMRMMPVMFVVFAWILPAGVSIYIITTNILTIIQQYFQLEREGYYDEKKATRYKTGEPLNFLEKVSFKVTDYGSIALIAVRLKPEPNKKGNKALDVKGKPTASKAATKSPAKKGENIKEQPVNKKKTPVTEKQAKATESSQQKTQSAKSTNNKSDKGQKGPSTAGKNKNYPAKKKK